jgi:hypothetical protein
MSEANLARRGGGIKKVFLHSSKMMEFSIFKMLPLWLLEHIQDREISIYFQISKL